MASGIKKTHEQFLNEVYDLVGDDYEVLGTYKNSSTKIQFKHNVCDHEYPVTPANFLHGKRCPKCAGNIKKTHAEFVEDVVSVRGDIYEFLTEYKNAKNTVKVKHKECGYEWDVQPSHLTDKNEVGKVLCPNCNNKIKHDIDTFKDKVCELVGEEYIVLDDTYMSANDYVQMKHNIDECGYEYPVKPTKFMNGNRCPKCFGKNRRTTEEFKQIVFELEGNDYIVVGDYVNNETPIKMKHVICGHEFDAKPSKFIHREKRCPICTGNSKGEEKIAKILNEKEIQCKDQCAFEDCRSKSNNLLRFDFAIFDYNNELNYIIEYDGQQHFEPQDFAGKGEEWALKRFNDTKLHDEIKNNYCKENNIKLYRIPYWYYDNIEEILDKIIHNQTIEVDETSFLVQL